MRKKNSLANIISASRGITAVIMLFFPVFSSPFWILYCWGGVSDMIDGPIARKQKNASALGSRIDSVADLLFVVCSAIIIFPAVKLPVWIWLWVAAIGVIKTGIIIFASCREKHLTIPHSKSNKLTGLFLFCLPFALIFLEPTIPAIIVCIIASISILEDTLLQIKTLKMKMGKDIKFCQSCRMPLSDEVLGTNADVSNADAIPHADHPMSAKKL